MPHVECKICSSSFYAKPRHLKIGWGKYCSSKCQYIGQRTGMYFPCAICTKKIWRTPRETKHSVSQKYFCGKHCQTVWRNKFYSGVKHPFWKTGIKAYRQILLRSGTPMECKFCDLKDKRILAVHHIDKNRNNNDLTNLTWLCHNCHFLIHHNKEEMEKLMRLLKQYGGISLAG